MNSYLYPDDTIIVATHNKGKAEEFKTLFSQVGITTKFSEDFNIPEPIEDGKTFKENSLIKAEFFSKKSNKICISDDSGLEIKLLNNQPGIYSARWGGKNGDFKKED